MNVWLFIWNPSRIQYWNWNFLFYADVFQQFIFYFSSGDASSPKGSTSASSMLSTATAVLTSWTVWKTMRTRRRKPRRPMSVFLRLSLSVSPNSPNPAVSSEWSTMRSLIYSQSPMSLLLKLLLNQQQAINTKETNFISLCTINPISASQHEAKADILRTIEMGGLESFDMFINSCTNAKSSPKVNLCHYALNSSW